MRIALFCCLLFMLNHTLEAQLRRYAFEHPQMGTTFRIVLYASDSAKAAEAAQAAFDRIDMLNRIMSDYDPESELNAVSATAGKDHWISISEDLWRVMTVSSEISQQTKGAFDITVGPMVQLWRRSRRKKQLPSEEALTAAKVAVGYTFLSFNPENKRVKLTREDMRLDLGGIAKGYATDEALEVLSQKGITCVLVDGGGDIAVGDPPPGQEGWNIGIEVLGHDQKLTNRTLYLSNCAVATSGDAYRYVELGGVRYSHIIDPDTGLGLTERRKVTIISPSGMMADAYASAVSAMGVDDGIAFINQKKKTAALILENKREQIHQFTTGNFWSYIESP